MNKTTYSIISLVYLIPLLLINVYQNTISTGTWSDFYFWLTGLSAFLALWAANDLFKWLPEAKTFEWIYAGLFTAYAGGNFFFLKFINNTSTDFIISPFALLWSFLSIGIVVVSGLRFWNLRQNVVSAAVSLKHGIDHLTE